MKRRIQSEIMGCRISFFFERIKKHSVNRITVSTATQKLSNLIRHYIPPSLHVLKTHLPLTHCKTGLYLTLLTNFPSTLDTH